MKYKKFKILIITSLALLPLGIKATLKRDKEVIQKITSLSMNIFKKDSTLTKRFVSFLNEKNNDNNIQAIELGLKLADDAIIKNESDIALKTFFSLAKIYSKTRNYKNSIEFYQKALKLIKTLNDNFVFENNNNFEQFDLTVIRAESMLGIASNFLRLEIASDEPEERNKYKDSSYFYHKKIINSAFLERNTTLLNIKAKAYSNLAGMYAADSSYQLAKDYANKAISIHKERNDELSEAAAISNLANVYLYQNKYTQAKALYEKGINLIKNNKSSLSIQFKENLYENLGYSMFMLKDYRAYEIQEISHSIKDSLRDKEIKKIIAEINGKYNVEVAKQIVRQEEELKRAKAERTTWIFGIACVTAIMSLLYLSNFYKLRQRNLQLKLEQSKLLEEQNIDRIKSDAQVKILNATIDGKETERKQIAETLHDSVSALLSSANMHLSATKKQFNGSTPAEILKTQEIILEASQKVRDLSHNLVSSILLKFGLEYAIKDIAKKYSNSELQFHTEFTNVARYSQEFEIKLYNVINELINNILKHSMASNAYIVLEDKNDFLSVLIEDDGVGFNYQFNNERTGLGLNQIEARIQMMNGNFLVESSKDRGAKVTISVPVQKKTEISYV